jgi:hypothetical protein
MATTDVHGKDGCMQAGHLHVVTIGTLASLGSRLAGVSAAESDPVLVLPPSGTLLLGSTDDLIDASLALEGGICVAASAIPLSTPSVAAQVADAVARASGWSPVSRGTGWRPARAYPYPYALLGPARTLFELSARLYGSPHQSDADLIATVLLEGGHYLVLDVAAQVFHLLDGTLTDAVAVAGRVHSGGEEPLIVVDPEPGAPSLGRLQDDLGDPGARDLGRLLRYDGAVDFDDQVFVAAPDILLSRFWTPEFCATIVRSAEAAAVWVSADTHQAPRSEVSLSALSPRLVAKVEEDLRMRIWPHVVSTWPKVIASRLQNAVIVRQEAGEGSTGLDPGEDLSEVSGAVRLNDGYLGGGLLFPRQGWGNRDVPVGSLSVFPSAFTHPHRLESVTRGVQYQLSLRWRPPRA